MSDFVSDALPPKKRGTGNDYFKERYERLKAEHCCVRCGIQDDRTLSGKVYCELCSKQNTSNVSRWRAKKIKNVPTYLVTSLVNLRDYCYETVNCQKCIFLGLCKKGILISELSQNFDEFMKENKENEKDN